MRKILRTRFFLVMWRYRANIGVVGGSRTARDDSSIGSVEDGTVYGGGRSSWTVANGRRVVNALVSRSDRFPDCCGRAAGDERRHTWVCTRLESGRSGWVEGWPNTAASDAANF